MSEKLIKEQKTTDLSNFSVRDLIKNPELLKPLKDEELHGRILWDIVNALTRADERQLPKLIGQFALLNVKHPEKIGESHLLQIISQLHSVLTNKLFSKWYSKYPKEVYEAIIGDLEAGGGLAKYVNEVERKRTVLGIATPIPLIEVMERVKKAIGKEDSALNVDIVKDISSFLKDMPLEEMFKLYPIDYVFTTTGFGRNQVFDAVRPFICPNGTYIEVGASLGIYAVDIKRALGFRRLVATDIMSESQAREIVSVTDYQKGGNVPYTEEHRKNTERDIDMRLWKHDILKDKIAPHITDRNGFFCFGFHNVLVHLIDKDVAVQNATEGLIKPNDVIWVSGGYCANNPIFPNLLYQKTPEGAKTYLIKDNKKVIPLCSQDVVIEEVIKGK